LLQQLQIAVECQHSIGPFRVRPNTNAFQEKKAGKISARRDQPRFYYVARAIFRNHHQDVPGCDGVRCAIGPSAPGRVPRNDIDGCRAFARVRVPEKTEMYPEGIRSGQSQSVSRDSRFTKGVLTILSALDFSPEATSRFSIQNFAADADEL
jgi:hypothetical protein